PVLSVWGGTTPECGFLGYGQSTDNAMLLRLPCQPCSIAGTKTCPLGTMACLKDLAPEAIVDRIIDMTAE
ncbi:MAG: glycosyl transferase family 1, partial [Muribaculaceae bacterium]|nr:glycosyl transferase family 1 [Muribaculaceae bacterium]